jgi:gamma-glutamyl-gamma-aminobutyrate hydrolase PuuD
MAKSTTRRIRAAKPETLPAVIPETETDEQTTVEAKPKDKQEEKKKEPYRVTVFKDDKLDYPELYLAVFIIGDRYEQAQFAQWMVKAKCRRASSLDDADLVVFTGGEDVDPQLYGERLHPKTRFAKSRDTSDILMYVECLKKGIPMLGVCRGMQFLHVMNGGKLYQHVDAHNSEHPMWDVKNKIKIDRISSVHHQACIPNGANGMELIGTSNKSTHRWLDDKKELTGTKMDVEALFYRETCCLGFQGHPEYNGYNFYSKWALDRINDYVICNPDLDWIGSVRRMKPDLLEQRKAIRKEQNALVSITQTDA